MSPPGAPATTRTIVWRRLDQPGLEHVRLRHGRGGVRAEAATIVLLDGEPLSCLWTLHCARDWSFRRARFRLITAEGERRLAIERRRATWRVDGAERPDLAPCHEIDIAITPLTNTLPIRRLGLAPGEERAITAAYVAFPALSVAPVAQTYTRLDHASPPRLFRYRGVFRDFTGDIAVDEEGLVSAYPETFARLV